MIRPYRDKTYLITGASSGLGLATARHLSAGGAQIIAAGRRNPGIGEFIPLDLGDIDSIYACADVLSTDSLDGLVNNAGVLLPDFAEAHGCEAHLGINFIGHFALTMTLLSNLAPNARIVHVTSMTAQFVRLNAKHLHQRPYPRGLNAYARSKLANLMFALELAERAPDLVSVAAHPGYSATALQDNLSLGRLGNALFAQRPEAGAAAILKALVDPNVRPGAFLGPRRWLQLRGQPVHLSPYSGATDRRARKMLWDFAEEVLQHKFTVPTGTVSR
jgi:protochlorophyllide reductase